MEQTFLQTPSQTVGPYFAYGLTPEQYGYDFKSLVANELIDPMHPDAIHVTGRVLDGNGDVIPDAMLELWHCDQEHQAFGRFGTGTDASNRFLFSALKPKSVNGNAPYFTLIVFMRGQLIHSYTRIYFEDESFLNATDQVLQVVPENRRKTLIASRNGRVYTFDVHMQGPNETVFFDI
ncbi:MAG: protocatechuate 3,4-dioxygenase subunit alpha [Bacteroidota bacterium]|jgi:protocatechuate 3,4-dioxygenase alpha subunit